MINLYRVFLNSVFRHPDAVAIVGDGAFGNLRYWELAACIEQMSGALKDQGVSEGDCVGLHLPSGPLYIIVSYALWRIGACVVPIPVELSPREVEEIKETIPLDAICAVGTSSFASEGCPVIASTTSVVRLKPTKTHPPGFKRMNPAFIRFTSGTTDRAKGVVLSHETVLERIEAANDMLSLTVGDRVLWLLSMSYHFAVSIVAYLSYGVTIVLPKNNLPQSLHEAVTHLDVTLIYGAPTHYAWLAAKAPDVPVRSLRLALCTTAALDPKTNILFRDRFGVPVSQVLGLIEIGLPFMNLEHASKKQHAVGKLLPSYRMCMRPCGLGPHAREVLLQGKGFLDAYYAPWQPRSEIMADGWFHTGDVGELDEDGCLILRGRLKSLISVGGMKFFPVEVESVLESHPAVRDSLVYAVSDTRLGEVPHAKVVLAGNAAEDADESKILRDLRRLCQEQLAAFKVPVLIESTRELAKTASGKRSRRSNEPSRSLAWT